MFNSDKQRSFKHCRVGVLACLVALGWICGCTSMAPDASKERWSCDPRADAAVESGQWQQALKRHERVFNSDPSNCLAMYHLGYIWGRLESQQIEVDWYNKAITCGYDHNDTLYFNLGMAYADLGQQAKAIAAFKRALMINPTNADNHFGLGITHRSMGDVVGTEQALKKAIAISPRHWDARNILANIYLDQGRLEAARVHLEYVIAHMPENEEAQSLYQVYKERRMSAFGR